MNYQTAESLLAQTFDEVRHQHEADGLDYIQTHWRRYAHLIRRFPRLERDHRVLEIGASILSQVARRRFGCAVDTLYHELEVEWPARFNPEGIATHPVELMRDPLPVPENSFDLILFNEVMEHLCLAPDAVVRQVIRSLRPGGVLLLSVPNFATSEKRLALLAGKNPQDPMDSRFVYYAHHREPVMSECVSLVEHNGGLVVTKEWSDCDVAPSLGATLWHCLRHLRHGKFHRVIHQLIPSMRASIIIEAKRDGSREMPALSLPLRDTGEFSWGKRTGRDE